MLHEMRGNVCVAENLRFVENGKIQIIFYEQLLFFFNYYQNVSLFLELKNFAVSSLSLISFIKVKEHRFCSQISRRDI